MKYNDLVKTAFALTANKTDKTIEKLIINSMTKEELETMTKFIVDITDYGHQFFKERGLLKKG